MVPIRENLLSSAKYDLKVPVESCAKDMKYIVVHNTANDASAANEVAYMIRNDSSTSFNAAVDDKEIVIGIPLSRGAFAAGQRDGNAHGIHIEICYSLSGGTRFDKAEKNAAEYIAQLLKERKWDISHVKKHQDFDGKYCPHRTLDKGWQRFLNMVKSYMTASTPTKPTPKPSTPKPTCTGDLTYSAYAGGHWLPRVKNCEDYAGNLGQVMEGLKINAKNCDIYYRVHLRGGGWLPEIKNSGAGADGYAGIYGEQIDGVQIRTPVGFVDCRVHIKGGGWLGWVRFGSKYNSGANGYAGIYGSAIDAIQME
jgi:hypothetical protein